MTTEARATLDVLHGKMERLFKSCNLSFVLNPIERMKVYESIKGEYKAKSTPQDTFEYELEQLSNEHVSPRQMYEIARKRVRNIFDIDF